MLKPQDNSTRETKLLDGLWQFVLDAEGAGRSGQWWQGPLPASQALPVPASYNDLFVESKARPCR